MTVFKPLNQKEIEEFKQTNDNYYKCLQTNNANLNYLTTSVNMNLNRTKSNIYLSTQEISNSNSTITNSYEKKFPNIFQIELRKTKKERELIKSEKKKSKLDFTSNLSNINFLNSLNNNLSFSQEECDIPISNNKSNHNNEKVKSYQMDHDSYKSQKIFKLLDREYEGFFESLEKKNKKFHNNIHKELKRKSDIESNFRQAY